MIGMMIGCCVIFYEDLSVYARLDTGDLSGVTADKKTFISLGKEYDRTIGWPKVVRLV
jgi:hypothetical protein